MEEERMKADEEGGESQSLLTFPTPEEGMTNPRGGRDRGLMSVSTQSPHELS